MPSASVCKFAAELVKEGVWENAVACISGVGGLLEGRHLDAANNCGVREESDPV